ncbi:conserved domain protein [Klebsiella variicola]|uniref:Conserved domain protein n=1 Tax=Klebsiella variicola (strain 342) TaxID=507522 RepID=B5XXT4_KLEV3|nr:conserved domain protein [Klebsiella variicola]
MLRCFVGLFNAQYQYHLHGMLRKPLRIGLSSGFLHKVANFPQLQCISICNKKYFTPSVSINSFT